MDINEKTRISLYAVVATIPFLFGGIFWLSTIYEQGAEAARVNVRQDRVLDEQGRSIDQVKDMVIEIRERTVRIEERLKRLR